VAHAGANPDGHRLEPADGNVDVDYDGDGARLLRIMQVTVSLRPGKETA
jgi:hypothetical protein